MSRLIESINLIERLFGGEPATFDGEYYQVSDFQSFPKPVQSPVPLMIGGRGKRMLTMAAKRAQIISILAASGEGGNRLAGFQQQLAWIADAGGTARADLMIGIRIPFGQLAETGESPRGVARRVGDRLEMTPEEVLESPFVLVGDLASIKDHLAEVRERFGVTYVTVSESLAWQIAPIVKELSVDG